MASIHTFYSSNGFSAQFIGCHRHARIDMTGSDAQVVRFARTMGFDSITKTIYQGSDSEGLNPSQVTGQRRKLFIAMLHASAKLGLVGGFDGHQYAANL